MATSKLQGIRDETIRVRAQLNRDNKKFFDDFRNYLYFASLL